MRRAMFIRSEHGQRSCQGPGFPSNPHPLDSRIILGVLLGAINVPSCSQVS